MAKPASVPRIVKTIYDIQPRGYMPHENEGWDLRLDDPDERSGLKTDKKFRITVSLRQQFPALGNRPGRVATVGKVSVYLSPGAGGAYCDPLTRAIELPWGGEAVPNGKDHNSCNRWAVPPAEFGYLAQKIGTVLGDPSPYIVESGWAGEPHEFEFRGNGFSARLSLHGNLGVHFADGKGSEGLLITGKQAEKIASYVGKAAHLTSIEKEHGRTYYRMCGKSEIKSRFADTASTL